MNKNLMEMNDIKDTREEFPADVYDLTGPDRTGLKYGRVSIF